MKAPSFLVFTDPSSDNGNPIALKTVEAGNIYGMVVSHPLGSGFFVDKHIANVAWEPWSIQMLFPINPQLLSVINGSLDGSVYGFNGQLAITYYHQDPRQFDFFNGFIDEISFPGADRNSKEARNISFRISAAGVRETNQKLPAEQQNPITEEEWLASNFSFVIGGLDSLKIIKVDSFTLNRNIPADAIGIFRDPHTAIPPFEIPNLRLTIEADYKDALKNWARSWFIEGHHLQADEKSGMLTCFSKKNKTLLEMKFNQIGLIKMSDSKEGIVLDLYFEKISFVIPNVTPAF